MISSESFRVFAAFVSSSHADDIRKLVC